MLVLERGGDISAVECLLSAGADPNVHDNKGKTPLMYAAESGRADSLRALLAAGADPNARDGEGETPLMYAAKGGDADSLRALLDAGVEVDALSKGYYTALFYAVEGLRSHGTDAMRVLLEAGADPDALGISYTPMLHFAVDNVCPEAVRLLLGSGAFINKLDKFNRTPLDAALDALEFYRKIEEIVEMLRKAGAEIGWVRERKNITEEERS